MPRPLRLLTAATLLGACATVAACGAHSIPMAGGPTLPPTPASVPSDFTSIAAMEQALDGVAMCAKQGGQVASCTLNIATDRTFRLQIFTTPGARAQYVASVQADDAQVRKAGAEPRGGLVGKSWALTPDVATPGLIPTLQPYLGGQSLN